MERQGLADGHDVSTPQRGSGRRSREQAGDATRRAHVTRAHASRGAIGPMGAGRGRSLWLDVLPASWARTKIRGSGFVVCSSQPAALR